MKYRLNQLRLFTHVRLSYLFLIDFLQKRDQAVQQKILCSVLQFSITHLDKNRIPWYVVYKTLVAKLILPSKLHNKVFFLFEVLFFFIWEKGLWYCSKGQIVFLQAFFSTHWSAIITPVISFSSADNLSSTFPTPDNGSLSPNVPISIICIRER